VRLHVATTDLRMVVVLTALDEEFRAVRDHLAGATRRVAAENTEFAVGRLADTTVELAVARVSVGTSGIAQVSTRALELFQPTALLWVGIAGGVRKDVQPGDVVVSDRVYSYESARQTDVQPADIDTLSEFHALVRVVAKQGSWTRYVDRALLAQPPEVHFGTAAQRILTADRVLYPKALDPDRHGVVAVEMEASGVVAEATRAHRVPFLYVRGISDLYDTKLTSSTDRTWRRHAAANAAAFVHGFIVGLESLSTAAEKLPQGEHGGSRPDGAWRTLVQLVGIDSDRVLAVVPAWDRDVLVQIPGAEVPMTALTALEMGQRPVRGTAWVNLDADAADGLRIDGFTMSPPVPTDESLGVTSDA
jgi:nucleoside phosphorylase